MGINFNAEAGSDVEIIGGAFKLNGADFADPMITLQANDFFTGTLQDGSPFIFFNNGTSGDFDQLNNVTLTEVALPEINTTPLVVNAANPSGPQGLGIGQVLALQDGGSLGVGDFGDRHVAFQALGATLNIEGGVLGDFAEVAESTVNINGGSVGDAFDAFSGSTVNVSGGSVGRAFDAFSGSTVNISGGSIGRAFVSSSFTIVGNAFDAFSGSSINISGGSIIGDFEAFSGSEVNLFGTEFSINGVLLEDLELNQAFAIVDRDVTLSGFLADGTAFSFFLRSDNNFFRGDFFSTDATLTVTQVPEPTSLAILSLGGLALLRRRRA